MKKVSINFIDNPSSLPFVYVYLDNGTSVIALVDTGSDSSVIDISVAKSNKDCISKLGSSQDINYIGMFSTSTQKTLNAKMNISLSPDGHKYETTVSVMDLSIVQGGILGEYGIKPEIIIGSNFLKDNKINLDFKNLRLLI